MGVRILLRTDSASKQFHAPNSLAWFSAHIRERVFRKCGSHVVHPKYTVSKTRCFTNGNLNDFHGLENGKVKFATHERLPNRLGNARMQRLLRQAPSDSKIREVFLVLEFPSSPVQKPPAGLTIRALCWND
jgi:hypothetical protein